MLHRLQSAEKSNAAFIYRSSQDRFQSWIRKQIRMNHLDTTIHQYSLNDLRNRHAKETAKKRQDREKRDQKCLTYLAHLLLYCKENPQVLDNSVRYLFELSQKYQIPKILVPIFQLKTLQIQLTTQQGSLLPSFFKKSLSILNEEVLKIVKTFRSPKLGINTQLDIKLELFAYFMKLQRQLKQYMPTQEGTIRKIPALGMLFNSSKSDTLRKFYDRYEEVIQFRPRELGIQELVSTYYILLLKKKFSQQKVRSKISQAKLNDVHKVMERINALRSSKTNYMQDNEGKVKRLFSDHYRLKKTIKRADHWVSKPQDVEEIARAFEEIRISKEQPSAQHPKIIYLEKQRGILTAKVLVKKYGKYKKQKERQQSQYGEDISALKIQLLTKYIRKDKRYTYEQILLRAFRKWLVFIDRPFYQENIVEILKKEIQYHQLVYINRVIEGIEVRKSEGSEIIFVDYFNTADEELSMKDQSEENSIIVAVGMNGSLSCRMYQGRMQEGLFLSEIESMFREIDKQSVFVFYDRKFPLSGWLKQQNIALLRKLHFLVDLPFIEAVPNPSQKLCQYIWHIVKEKMNQNSMNEKSSLLYLEQAVKNCQGTHIVEQILNRQWEKTKCLTLKGAQQAFMQKYEEPLQAFLFVDQRNQQIPKMENLDSMNREQLGQFLSMISSGHTSYILQRYQRRVQSSYF